MAETNEPRALYSLEFIAEFAGAMPNGQYNQDAPEVEAVYQEAVEAVLGVLNKHGYQVVRSAHGVARVGTHFE